VSKIGDSRKLPRLDTKGGLGQTQVACENPKQAGEIRQRSRYAPRPTVSEPVNKCNREWLLKKSVTGMSFLAATIVASEFFVLTSAKW
jgi:hypothetical protein